MKTSISSLRPLVEVIISMQLPLKLSSIWNPKPIWPQTGAYSLVSKSLEAFCSVKTPTTARWWAWTHSMTTRLLTVMKNGLSKTPRWKTGLLATYLLMSSMFSRMWDSKHQLPTARKCNLFRWTRAALLVMKANKKWLVVRIITWHV